MPIFYASHNGFMNGTPKAGCEGGRAVIGNRGKATQSRQQKTKLPGHFARPRATCSDSSKQQVKFQICGSKLLNSCDYSDLRALRAAEIVPSSR